jgi:hypothetical protein
MDIPVCFIQEKNFLKGLNKKTEETIFGLLITIPMGFIPMEIYR